ncbi:MAG: LysM peptidoglycan-binding domain-containing protein, partial [Synechococcus sp. ELA057]
MRGSLAALMLALILPLPALAGQVTVKPGETLSEIADRYGISVNRLMSLNGLQRANHVEAGTVLQIPGSGGGSRSASAGSAGRSGGSSITVQRGQTLSEIAEQQGISLTTLMRINGISDPDQVVAGQQLRLSGGTRSTASSSTSSSTRGGASITVQRGQTLSEIAEQQG